MSEEESLLDQVVSLAKQMSVKGITIDISSIGKAELQSPRELEWACSCGLTGYGDPYPHSCSDFRLSKKLQELEERIEKGQQQ